MCRFCDLKLNKRMVEISKSLAFKDWPEDFNMIITASQSISSSIQFVGQILLILVVTHLVSWFMK